MGPTMKEIAITEGLRNKFDLPQEEEPVGYGK